MPDNLATEYFKKKLETLNAPKQASITEAMTRKVADLQEYQAAVAQGNAFLEPDRSGVDVLRDVAVTGLKGAIGLPEALVGLADIPTGGAVGKAIEESTPINFREAKQVLDGELSDAQKEATRRVQLAKGFIGTLQASFENPSTIAATVGESLPQMLGGAAVARGLMKLGAGAVAAGAAGEGILGAGSAAEQIRGENADKRLSFKQALAAVGSGVGTAAFGLAGGKVAQRLGVTDIDTALAAGTLKSPAGFIKALAGSGISEGVFEELPQSAQEQMWQNFATDKPIFEGVDKAAAVGLAAGLAMGQTVGTVSATAGALASAGKPGEKPLNPIEKKAAELQTEAIKTGDVSALADPKLPTYSPSNAVSALNGFSDRAEATAEEKQASLEKSTAVVEAHRDLLSTTEELLKSTTPEGIAEYKARLEEARVANEAEIIPILEAAISKGEQATPAQRQALEVQVANMRDQLTKAEENLGRFTTTAAASSLKASEVEATVTELSAPVDSADTAATSARVEKADKLINLSMTAPGTLTPQQAQTLATAPGNGLAPAQRTYLQQFSTARQATAVAKSLPEVQQDVFYGGKGFLGLNQHRDRIGSALTAGNPQRVDSLMGVLQKFAGDHQAKLDLAAQAWNGGAGKGAQIERDATTNKWVMSPQRRSDPELRKLKGLTMNTGRLVEAIKAEAEAINATLRELEAARDLKFGAKSATKTKGAQPNVKNVPVAPSATQDAAAKPKEIPATTTAEQAPNRAATGSTAATRPAASQPVPVEEKKSAEKAEAKTDSKVSEPATTVAAEQPDTSASTAVEETQESQETQVEEKSESQAEAGDASVSAETEAVVDAGQDSAPEGRLSVFSKPTSEDAPNPVVQHLAQVDQRKGDKTKRPLVAEKNFLDVLLERAGEYLPVVPSETQFQALNAFAQQARAWMKRITADVPPKPNPGFEFENVMNYLVNESEDGTRDLDQNVKTAIAYALWSWVASEASSSAFSDKKSINNMLGKQKDSPLDRETYNALARVGKYQHNVADSMGGTALEALGLRASDDASQELMSRLRTALGTYALKLAEDSGLVTRTTFSAEKIAGFRGETFDKANARSEHHFFALKRNGDLSLPARVDDISRANKGTKGILDKLFSVQSYGEGPSLEPITDVPQFTKGTQMEVPQKLKDILLTNQARPRKLRTDMLFLLDKFGDEARQRMFGVTPEENETVHRTGRMSTLAKNDGLRREWEQFTDWISDFLVDSKDGLETPFYYRFMPWKQQRVGIATTIGNPQTSKIARQLVYSPEWETEVRSTDEDAMKSFILRVGEGLGIKTERQDNEASGLELFKKLQEPVYQRALEVLRKNPDGQQEMSDSDQNAVVAGVLAGGENLHSLNALMAMAVMLNAQAEAKGGDYSFKTKLMGEVDGVANGTILNHILLGAGATAEDLNQLLEVGGVYTVGSSYSQYNQYRGAPGNLDIYESTARDVHEALQEQLLSNPQDFSSRQIQAIWAIAGRVYDESKGKVTKDGRNLIKEALNPLAFGSGLAKVVNGMSDTFVERIYTEFEKLAEQEQLNEAHDQAAIDALVRNINVLILGQENKLPLGRPLSWHMENALTKAQIESIKKGFGFTVGKATKKVVESRFSSFIDKRNSLTGMSNVAYSLYQAVYEGEREAFIEELIAKGEIKLNNKGERISDLSKKQEKQLRRRLKNVQPIVKTFMGGANWDSGLRMAKTKRKQNPAPEYANNTKFGTPNKLNRKSAKMHGYSTQEEGPGVAMASATTHSSDSAVSHLTQELMDVLNIHDAVGTGVGQLGDAARLMNQKTWEVMLGYSPMSSMYEALSSVIEGLGTRSDQERLSPQAARRVQEYLQKLADDNEMSVDQVLDNMLTDARMAAHQADLTKFEAMSQWAYVDQYAFEGGNYEVTDADRDAALRKLKAEQATKGEVPAEHRAAVKAFMKAVTGKAEEEVQATSVADMGTAEEVEPVVDGDTEFSIDDAELDEVGPDPELPPWDLDDPGEKVQAKTLPSSPFGTVGTPAQTNKKLVEYFKRNPEVSAQAAISKLLTMTGETQPYQRVLLQLLRKAVGDDVKVKVITPESTLKDVIEPPKGTSFGWIVGNEIYILNEGFENSGLQTPEVLLHELVHGALAAVIDNPTGDAVELVNDLKVLMEQANELATAEQRVEFGSALTDVQEFVAYGMTRKSFQRMLANMPGTESKVSPTNKLTAIDGFKAFVAKLVALLFKRSSKSQQEQAASALAQMINSVTGLFNQATTDKQVRKDDSPPWNLSSAVGSYTTQDLHQALDGQGLSSEFDGKLSSLLDGIVHKLHGPYGAFKALMQARGAMTAEDVFEKALDTGAAPLALSVSRSPIQASQRELHAMEQVEAVVRAALSTPEVSTRLTYKELKSLFEEAKERIQPSDFASPDEYDFIFKIENDSVTGRSEHLARFAAFTLAHQEFNQKMQIETQPSSARVQPAKTFADRLQRVFERILSFFSERVSGVFTGQRADLKVEKLVEQLVDIEAKKRVTASKAAAARLVVDSPSPVKSPVAFAEQAVAKGGEKLKAGVYRVANSSLVRNNRNIYVKLAGSLARLGAKDKADYLALTLTQFRDKNFPGLHGLPTEILTQFKGFGQTLNMLQLISTNAQRQRKDMITQTTKAVTDAFEDSGEYFKDLPGKAKAARAAITQVFLRTGMHSLLDSVGIQDLQRMLQDSGRLAQEQDTVEQSLRSDPSLVPYVDQFIHQANALGYFRVTGEVKHPRLMMNAHNIARLYGTNAQGRLTESQARAAQPMIEKLVSLYAMQYLSSAQKGLAVRIMQKEGARANNQNGVEFVLNLHKKFEESSKDLLFRNQDALMMHGFTPEIVNPGTVIAVADEAQGQELEYQGYVKMGTVPTDPADPDQTPKFMYRLNDGGLARFQTGVMSYTGKRSKGSSKHTGYLNPNTDDGLSNASLNADVASAKPAGLAVGARPDLSKVGGKFMAPIVNPQGEIVNWRYLMADSVKDNVMERDNAFHNVLGVLAGSIYDKVSTKEVNSKAIGALQEMYQQERYTNPDAYVLVGPRSDDERLREVWKMLPQEARNEAKNTFNADGMYVRKDLLLPVFGFRAYSLAESFKKDRDARNMAEKIIVDLVEQAYAYGVKLQSGLKGVQMDMQTARKHAKKIAVLITRGEKGWQEVVHAIKDIIVVKSIKVMVDNVISNWTQLLLSGVPIRSVLKHHLVAMRGARTYERDHGDLMQLEAKVFAGQAPANAQQEIARLKDALARNPVKELIEAGLMPTIVEDVAADDGSDLYSYKSQLGRKVEGLTKRVPKGLVTAGKWALMTHDTPIYKGLSQITRLSDFVARYTLYQHLTETKVKQADRNGNRMTAEEALNEASEAFVNYDSPLPRSLQYLDTMGIIPFTKYYMRIQRVLFKLAKDNPARVLATLLLNNFVDLGPIVLESSWIHRLGNNPFQWGAFQLPGTVDELATVAGATSLFK